MKHALAIAWLTGLWVLLWRDASPANLALGCVLAVVVVALFGPSPPSAHRHRLHPLGLVQFLAHFAVKLVEANIVVAREVVTPKNAIETGIIAVPMEGCSEMVITIVANAVSLTPGTLTVELVQDEPPTLYIHVLHLHDIERAREDVRTLSRLVRQAFPSTRIPTTTNEDLT